MHERFIASSSGTLLFLKCSLNKSLLSLMHTFVSHFAICSSDSNSFLQLKSYKYTFWIISSESAWFFVKDNAIKYNRLLCVLTHSLNLYSSIMSPRIFFERSFHYSNGWDRGKVTYFEKYFYTDKNAKKELHK